VICTHGFRAPLPGLNAGARPHLQHRSHCHRATDYRRNRGSTFAAINHPSASRTLCQNQIIWQFTGHWHRSTFVLRDARACHQNGFGGRRAESAGLAGRVPFDDDTAGPDHEEAPAAISAEQQAAAVVMMMGRRAEASGATPVRLTLQYAQHESLSPSGLPHGWRTNSGIVG